MAAVIKQTLNFDVHVKKSSWTDQTMFFFVLKAPLRSAEYSCRNVALAGVNYTYFELIVKEVSPLMECEHFDVGWSLSCSWIYV